MKNIVKVIRRPDPKGLKRGKIYLQFNGESPVEIHSSLFDHLKRIRAIKSPARAEASRQNGKLAAASMTKAHRVARATKAVAARIAKAKGKLK